MATHSSILAWGIPWTEEPGRMQSMGLQRRTQEHTHTHTHRVTVWLKVAQLVKNPPSKQETWVRSLCWEDPLEEEMATHSSILVWEIPWIEEPSKLQSMETKRVRHNLETKQ